MSSTVRRLLQPLSNRIALMIGRVILAAIDDSGDLQRVQITGLKGETRSGLSRLQNYGFYSVPLAGAYGIALFQGGDRQFGSVVVADDPRYRPTGWAAGEVGMQDHLGKFIRMRSDGVLEINAPTILLKSDDVRLGDSGGAQVARVGDRVNVGGGSSAGLWPIVEGSDKATAA